MLADTAILEKMGHEERSLQKMDPYNIACDNYLRIIGLMQTIRDRERYRYVKGVEGGRNGKGCPPPQTTTGPGRSADQKYFKLNCIRPMLHVSGNLHSAHCLHFNQTNNRDGLSTSVLGHFGLFWKTEVTIPHRDIL